MTRAICTAFIAAAVCACKAEGSADTAPSAVPSAVAPPPSAAAPPAPWFSGTWSATVPVERHDLGLEPKQGGMPQWKADDGKTAAGEVAVTITITDDGAAQGKATGALGELRGSGLVEDEHLSMDLTPIEADGFRGVLSAKRADDSKLDAELRASSADSTVVRVGKASLSKSTEQ